MNPLTKEQLREKIDNILTDQHHKFHSLWNWQFRLYKLKKGE